VTAVWLDIARLCERAVAGSLTGIDRVELAYAQTLRDKLPGRLRYVMLHPWLSRFCVVPWAPAVAFLDALTRAWEEGNPGDCRRMAMALLARATLGAAPAAGPEGAVYLLVSHRHLQRRAALEKALRRSRAAFVTLLHDVIPMTHPEYVRPGDGARHAERVETAARLASGVIVNSWATAASLSSYLPRGCPMHVAPLGVTQVADAGPAASPGRPYFLCVGTIEPRKNHLMLLQVWRRMVEMLGDAAPRLEIVGGRGWENENVLDMLDRSPVLRGHVVEHGRVNDRRLNALMRGARAVLMPSFAEGFGLPVAEALAAGTPVICSDLPALRETGGPVPEYIDPLDASYWATAVQSYADEESVRRVAQCQRLAAWRPVTWAAHADGVLSFLASEVVRAVRPVSVRGARVPLPGIDTDDGLLGEVFIPS
jgi:glycosyltransferase involved in cell wall biosynthesis